MFYIDLYINIYKYIYDLINIYVFEVQNLYKYRWSLYHEGKVIDKCLQCATYLQSYTQIWLVNDKYSYQTLTKQKRCRNMVKTGHWDLILTTLLSASGRFQTKGEIRPNVTRKPMYE